MGAGVWGGGVWTGRVWRVGRGGWDPAAARHPARPAPAIYPSGLIPVPQAGPRPTPHTPHPSRSTPHTPRPTPHPPALLARSFPFPLSHTPRSDDADDGHGTAGGRCGGSRAAVGGAGGPARLCREGGGV